MCLPSPVHALCTYCSHSFAASITYQHTLCCILCVPASQVLTVTTLCCSDLDRNVFPRTVCTPQGTDWKWRTYHLSIWKRTAVAGLPSDACWFCHPRSERETAAAAVTPSPPDGTPWIFHLCLCLRTKFGKSNKKHLSHRMNQFNDVMAAPLLSLFWGRRCR